jgi:membrane protein
MVSESLCTLRRHHVRESSMRHVKPPAAFAPLQPSGVRMSTLPACLWPAARIFIERDAQRHGAALAFYTVFSLAPLLVVVTAGIALLLGMATAQNAIADYIQRVLGAEEARVIVGMMLHARERLQSNGMAAWLALGSTLLGASATFLELKAALASIWGLRQTSGTGAKAMIAGRLDGIALALGIGFLLGVTLLAEAALRTAVAWAGQDLSGLDLTADVVNLVVVNAFSTGLFALLLARLAPNTRVWRDALPAAVVITVLFAAGRFLIAAYLTHAGVTSAYGAAGSLAAILVWCYASAQIFLFGACVMYVQQRHGLPEPGASCGDVGQIRHLIRPMPTAPRQSRP